MKKILVTLIVINVSIFISFSKEKSENLFFKKIILIDNENLIDYKLKPTFYNDTLYYVSNEFYNLNDTLYVDLICPEDSTKSIKYIIPRKIQDKKLFITDIFVNDSLVIMLDLMNILIYKRNEQQIFKLIILPYSHFYLNFYDNKIFCYNDISASANLTLTTRLYYSVYNLNGEKFYFQKFKEPEGIDFTYFQPRKIIDIFEDNVIVSNITKYELYLYNLQGKIIDTLSRKLDTWIYNDSLKLKTNTIDRTKPKKYLFNYMKYMLTQSLIERVYFINSNKIFIAWSSPIANSKKRNYYYDLWYKKSDKWILQNSVIDGDPIEFKDLKLNLLKLSRKHYVIKNEHLISLETIPFKLTNYDFDNDYSTFSNKIDNFLLKNSLKYSFLIRSFK